MSEVKRWLESRRPAPPPALRECMDEALDASGAGAVAGVAGRLAEGALNRLEALLASGGGREDALDLLTADALLTYAFEAAAEAGPEAVVALARAYGPERIASLVDGTGDG